MDYSKFLPERKPVPKHENGVTEVQEELNQKDLACNMQAVRRTAEIVEEGKKNFSLKPERGKFSHKFNKKSRSGF